MWKTLFCVIGTSEKSRIIHAFDSILDQVNTGCTYFYLNLFFSGYYHGYNTKKKVKNYDNNCLQNKILVTSNLSALELSYLYTCVLSICIAKTQFGALAEIYNELHGSIDEEDECDEDEKGLTRTEVREKRLAEGVYLYML